MSSGKTMTGKRLFYIISAASLLAAIVLQVLLKINYIYSDGKLSPILLIVLLMLFVQQLKNPRYRITAILVYAAVTGVLILISGSFRHMGVLHILLYLLPILYLLLCGEKSIQNYFVQKKLVR